MANGMADQSLLDQSFAAFFGALAAFLLEALRRWRSERREKWMAGNAAVFALAQMYSLVVGLHRQQFLDQIERFKKERGREPNYSEFLPLEVGKNEVMRPRLDDLGFLLRSYDPDVLNRLSVVIQRYDVLINAMHQLNHAQNQWQQAYAKILNDYAGDLRVEQIEDLIGPYLTVRLQMLVQSLQQVLPDCAKELKTVGEQLSEALSFAFPTRMVSKFEHIERNDPTELPPSMKRPSLWRRCLRSMSRAIRRIT